MWWSNRRAPNEKIVFFSNKTENYIQGNITGNLFKKNCTTVLNNILLRWTSIFSFRIEDNNPLKYNFAETVKINVKDSPPSPQVTINRDMVKEGDSVTLREGDSVTLICSAPAPCPSLPPTLSWTPRLSDSVTVFQENDDHTKHVFSVMTFTASHLLHKQEIKCTAVYRLQADNSERTSHTNVTLNVQYSPKNTLVLIGKDGSLTCSSDANPAVNNYTWYKVTGSEIEVVSYTQSLTCNITEVSGQYYCQAQNEHGLQNSSTVQPHCESVKAPPTLIGAAAGAAGMILTCILLTIILKKSCTRQNHGSETQETGELTLTNQVNTPEPKEEATYGNICHQLGTKGPDKM
ncbi:B-cell receptor CD22-like isoform X2 [Paramormyrops kingsleyae]|uniref:B-cell receptor CD22-like isoform X2 n=1 Tax=Paramormyrops kingsleyae TaxID=1676925 RepID=UPI003B96E027